MAQEAIFEDGFPCDPESANFVAHQEMTSDLVNCAALWSTHAPPGLLFPKCCAQTRRPSWTAAAAERLDPTCEMVAVYGRNAFVL